MKKIFTNAFTNTFIDNKSNFVLSPLGYNSVLKNLLPLVNGKNKKDLCNVFGIQEADVDEYLRDFKSWEDKVGISNSNFFLYKGLLSPYLNGPIFEKLKGLGVDISSFDLSKGADRLCADFNDIVSKNTNGIIKDLFSPDDINPLLVFVLLNCNYFKGEPYFKFEKETFFSAFKGDNSRKDLYFLSSREHYRYYEDDELDIVEIPYKNTSVCLYIFLPKSNLFDICLNFGKNYDKITKVESDCIVDLKIPEFKVEQFLNLNKATKDLGLSNLFLPSKDWSLVNFDLLKGETVINVSKIIQKSYVNFTKDYTEAASATSIMFTGCFSGLSPITAPPKVKYINVRNPFAFVIADKEKTDCPLFAGAIKNL